MEEKGYMKEKGYVHIYFGDGKGKTTAAAGLILRSAGNGRKVYVSQFLKDGSSGECRVLKTLPQVTWKQGDFLPKFTFQMTPRELEQTREECSRLLEQAGQEAAGFDLVVLDEVLYALRSGLLEEQALLDFLDRKPEQTELVLTGNYLTPALKARADYITEMKKIRHPYDQGVTARKGIEK